MIFITRKRWTLTLVACWVALLCGIAAATGDDTQNSYRLTVNFEENTLDLTPQSAAALDSMSAIFARNKHHRYEVHGYSCPMSGGQAVTRLAPKRVERMVEHLLSLGVPDENILTVVNAPKAADGAKVCMDDRRVDIISSGTHWRIEELSARQAELQAAIAAASESGLADSLKAELAELKRKLAESGRPEAPPSNAAPEPTPPAPIQPVASESGKQTVAVYMANEEPQGAKGVHNIMGGELARVLSESDKYTAVDRTEAILAQLDKEQAYQRSGAVDDDQIKAIGHQLGVEFLCISNINPIGKRYYLDTRFVNVVTAELVRSVTATSTLKDAEEMTRVGRNIALELLEADKTRQQRAMKKKIFRYTAIGLDVLGAGALAYGYWENGNVEKNVKVDRPPENKNPDEASLGHITDGPEADRAATRRNVAYVAGGVLLAGGITIHILF